MNFAAVVKSLALVASFSSSFLTGTAMADTPTVTRGRHALKGKKSKKGGGHPHCKEMQFVVIRSEIQRWYDDNGMETSSAPIYGYDDDMNLVRAGFVERKVQYINQVDYSNGALLFLTQSFDYDSEAQVYRSQFTSQGTAFGDLNSITGGFGAFECATGTELHTVITTDDGEEHVVRDLKICGGCGNEIEDVVY